MIMPPAWRLACKSACLAVASNVPGTQSFWLSVAQQPDQCLEVVATCTYEQIGVWLRNSASTARYSLQHYVSALAETVAATSSESRLAGGQAVNDTVMPGRPTRWADSCGGGGSGILGTIRCFFGGALGLQSLQGALWNDALPAAAGSTGHLMLPAHLTPRPPHAPSRSACTYALDFVEHCHDGRSGVAAQR